MSARIAEALYDAGYRKRDPNDDLADAYDYICQNRITFPKRHALKFLFIENGSVDMKKFLKYWEKVAPDIKIVVYAKGSQCPKLVEVEE